MCDGRFRAPLPSLKHRTRFLTIHPVQHHPGPFRGGSDSSREVDVVVVFPFLSIPCIFTTGPHAVASPSTHFLIQVRDVTRTIFVAEAPRTIVLTIHPAQHHPSPHGGGNDILGEVVFAVAFQVHVRPAKQHNSLLTRWQQQLPSQAA